jgi:hypothetical protein
MNWHTCLVSSEDYLGADVDLVANEGDEATVPWEWLVPKADNVLADELQRAEPLDKARDYTLAEEMTDSVRMNTTASAVAGPMICANCRRGEQTNTMGWLKLGEMDTGGI